ncbi:hypothetical protein Tco_0240649 [Tanacetum coccineum]
MDLTAAAKNHFIALNELMELRDEAYENTWINKEKIKKWHDSRLRGDKNFTAGDKVLLFNSRFRLHPGKLKSKWDYPLPAIRHMAPLPAADQRHPWLRYEVEGYTPGIVHSYEQRLETIWSRPVNRVHVLDFEGLTPEMRQDLAVRLRMVYSGEGQQVFVSHAWRRLFGIRGPLVREFILEFLSTCRMSDTEMGLDVADTLCFQLGGARRRMTWIQFILELGLHTEQEMAEAGFGAYWAGSDRLIPDKGDLRDY